MKTIVLNPFTLDVDEHAHTHGLSCPDVSLTVQSDVEQSDINTIVRQFGLTHELPYGKQVPTYDDFSDVPDDYHQAMNFIRAADDVFMTMPAQVRSKFDNDAGNFLNFVNDDANYDEAISLGLVPPKPAGSAEPNASFGSAEPVGQQATE